MKLKHLRIFFNTRRCSVVVAAALIGLCWHGVAQGALFHDALGRTVRLEATPKRIVAMAPSLTEILYYLGLGDRVVGVTKFSDYPAEARKKPNIGSYINVNVEKIISLSPDLAIGTADGNKPKVVKLLNQAGVPVYIVNPRNVRDVFSTMVLLGELCGIGAMAREFASRLEGRADRIYKETEGLRKPLVFLQINARPIMTVNRKTFHHDLIRLAGGKNMTADEPITYPRISLEEVIRRRPEVIIISSMERGSRFEVVRRSWLKWSSIPAVKAGRVHSIDPDLLDRPSPRLVEALEKMARMIHPELGWKPESAR